MLYNFLIETQKTSIQPCLTAVSIKKYSENFHGTFIYLLNYKLNLGIYILTKYLEFGYLLYYYLYLYKESSISDIYLNLYFII